MTEHRQLWDNFESVEPRHSWQSLKAWRAVLLFCRIAIDA